MGSTGTARSVVMNMGALGLVAALAGAGVVQAQAPALRCAAGQTQGVPAADAETAVALVCAEVARAVHGTAGEYRVDLRPLGRAIVLMLARDHPPDSRTLRLESIEEMPVAAARVAEALVHGLPIEQTRRVDNLVDSETRYTPLRKGSLRPALGIVGLGALGHGADSGAGFSLGLEYSAPRFSIPGELRVSGSDGSSGDGSLSVVSISTGGRYYFSRRGSSPFAGAGLSWLSMRASSRWDGPGRGFHGNFDGLAPYFEGGVELLRLHRARLRAVVRADVPVGQVESYNYCDYDYRTGQCRERAPDMRYVVPVTFGLGVSF